MDFLSSFFNQNWPQYSGGFSFMFLGLQIWCRNDLPQAYVDGKIVAAREGGLQKTKPCAFDCLPNKSASSYLCPYFVGHKRVYILFLS